MTSRAMRFPCVLRANTFAPQEVLGLRHGLEVLGVTAAAVPAKMVKVEAIGDRPNKRLIRNSVGEQRPVTKTHHAVARTSHARDLPASSRLDQRGAVDYPHERRPGALLFPSELHPHRLPLSSGAKQLGAA